MDEKKKTQAVKISLGMTWAIIESFSPEQLDICQELAHLTHEPSREGKKSFRLKIAHFIYLFVYFCSGHF